MKNFCWREFATGTALLASCACSDGTPPAAGAGGASSSSGGAVTAAAGASNAAGSATASSAGAGGQAGSSPSSGGVSTAGGQGGMGGSATGTGGALAGAGGALAGAGGALGGTGGGGGGAQAGSAGAGGGDGWVSIFNGQDLTGWVPLIHKLAYNQDPNKTFRVDLATKVIRVTYEDYPGQSFDDHCGLLYYNKPLTDYRVRLTYHFREPQAKNPVSWGKNNSGLMIFGIDPSKVTGDPEFPPIIEIQLLGTPSAGGTTNANLCQPGGMSMAKLFGQNTGGGNCHNSKSGTAPAADQWVTVEAEVHVAADTNVYQCVQTGEQPCTPDTTKPVLTMSGPTYNGQAVTSGYLAIQSESQPVEFKDILLKELK